MKVYIVTLEWDTESGKEFEVSQQGFSTLEKAQAKVKELFEQENENGWFDKDDESVNIEYQSNGWSIDVNYYEKYVMCEIVEIEID